MSINKKKILIITPFNPAGIGGAETFTLQLLDAIEEHVDVDLLTCPPLKKAWDDPTFWDCFGMMMYLLPRAIWRTSRKRYDTVHCLGIIATSVGAVLKKLFRVKLIATTLAIYDVLMWPMFRRMVGASIMKHADMVFVEDHIGRMDMLRLHVPNQKIKEFMHWVNLERFKPGRPLSKKMQVLFIGRPIAKKGIDIIKEVERQFKERKLKVGFTYVENIPYKDLPNYYQRADVFVVPSKYEEGVARVVLEAAASGCAVVSSDVGSLQALVRPFGIAIPADAVAFKETLLDLYMNNILLQGHKQTSRAYAMQNFSAKNAEVFLENY